jgi:hypothetical protein
VTAAEAFELTTHGGATDFSRVIEACEKFGPYCVIGGLAVNCYVDPVYTLDADMVAISSKLPELKAYLSEQGFRIEAHEHSLNAWPSGSDLRIQFTTDERYQPFLERALDGEILGVRVKIACVDDVARGKMWAYSDPHRRLSKRKKDELDLIRLAEAYPRLKAFYPRELIEQIEKG